MKAVPESELSHAIGMGIYKLPVTGITYSDALDNASISAENAAFVILFCCISALFLRGNFPGRLTAAVNKIPSIYEDSYLRTRLREGSTN